MIGDKKEEPKKSLAGTWCWAYTEDDTFNGSFATKEDAIVDGVENGGHDLDENEEPTSFVVGRYENPSPPEDYIDAELLIEHIRNQDDFSGDAGDDWPGTDGTQDNELTQSIRRVFGEWLDKHQLRPDWYMVVDIETVEPPSPLTGEAEDADAADEIAANANVEYAKEGDNDVVSPNAV